MAEVTVPMEEAGMLSDIMSDAPERAQPEPEKVEARPEPVKEEAPSERPRDESGRFVAKDPESQPEATEAEVKTPEPKEDAQVPSWRLRELREQREAAERRAEDASRSSYALQQQLQAMQRELQTLKTPKAEPVDFFQNPDEAFQQRLAPVQSEMEKFKSELRLEMSRELAVVKHGEQTVADVEAAVQKAMQSNHPEMPLLAAQMRNSSNPVAVAIKWHQNNKLLETTGGNLETYREKVLEEAMKDPKYQARVLEATRAQAGQTATPSNIRLPPSLNKATGAGISNADPDDNDASDAALFRQAMRR